MPMLIYYIDEVLVKLQDSDEIYYAHDHLYSPVALLDDEGMVLERYEYDAYGKPAIWDAGFTSERSTSNYDNPYLFTGRRSNPPPKNINPVNPAKIPFILFALRC